LTAKNEVAPLRRAPVGGGGAYPDIFEDAELLGVDVAHAEVEASRLGEPQEQRAPDLTRPDYPDLLQIPPRRLSELVEESPLGDPLALLRADLDVAGREQEDPVGDGLDVAVERVRSGRSRSPPSFSTGRRPRFWRFRITGCWRLKRSARFWASLKLDGSSTLTLVGRWSGTGLRCAGGFWPA
jgi:hypothetical protein